MTDDAVGRYFGVLRSWLGIYYEQQGRVMKLAEYRLHKAGSKNRAHSANVLRDASRVATIDMTNVRVSLGS